MGKREDNNVTQPELSIDGMFLTTAYEIVPTEIRSQPLDPGIAASDTDITLKAFILKPSCIY